MGIGHAHLTEGVFSISAMLFKVIKTIQSGKSLLAIVPDAWETDGTLYWPSKHKVGILNIGDILYPGTEWVELDCIVKRKNLKSYDDAKRDVEAGGLNSDSSGSEVDVPLARHRK